jgi:hypothetical protein
VVGNSSIAQRASEANPWDGRFDFSVSRFATPSPRLRHRRRSMVWRISLSGAGAGCFSRFLILFPKGDKPRPRLIMEL